LYGKQLLILLEFAKKGKYCLSGFSPLLSLFFVSNASLFPCISASPSEKLLDAKGYMESPVMCSPSLCRASSIAMEDDAIHVSFFH
jgi:hypothetical protein